MSNAPRIVRVIMGLVFLDILAMIAVVDWSVMTHNFSDATTGLVDTLYLIAGVPLAALLVGLALLLIFGRDDGP